MWELQLHAPAQRSIAALPVEFQELIYDQVDVVLLDPFQHTVASTDTNRIVHVPLLYRGTFRVAQLWFDPDLRTGTLHLYDVVERPHF